MRVGARAIAWTDSVCSALGDGLLASTIIANRSDPQAGARELLDNAAANAARDTLTVVVVVVGPRGPVAEGLIRVQPTAS
jgi:hypothetical protein